MSSSVPSDYHAYASISNTIPMAPTVRQLSLSDNTAGTAMLMFLALLMSVGPILGCSVLPKHPPLASEYDRTDRWMAKRSVGSLLHAELRLHSTHSFSTCCY